MSRLNQAILDAALSQPEGGLLAPRAFLHLGSRAAVDQAFSRLVRSGQLLRVGRGAYALPVQGKFGPRAPSTQATVQGLSALSGEAIVPSGAAEANALGLTTQVPVREVFVTSGRSRTLQLGARQVELRHAPAWQVQWGPSQVGRVVRCSLSIGWHCARPRGNCQAGWPRR
jgi:Family of unknown function (DUF6088)